MTAPRLNITLKTKNNNKDVTINQTTSNNKKTKSNSPTTAITKNENLKPFQSLNNHKSTNNLQQMSLSSRSKSPRKKQSSSLVEFPILVESVDRNETIENVTITNMTSDQIDRKNKKMTTSLSPVSLSTNPTIVTSNSISTLHTNASNDKQHHHTPSKKNKYNRRKSSRKVVITSTSNQVERENSNNKIMVQDDNTICTTSSTKDGHNTNPIDGAMTKPNMNDENKDNNVSTSKNVDDNSMNEQTQTHQIQQKKQQHSKWHKGNNRKSYYKSPRHHHQRQQGQQRKGDHSNAVQQRDVSNSKVYVEDEDERNASSLVNMIPKTIASSDVNTIVETSKRSDKRDVGPHHDKSIKPTYHGSHNENRNHSTVNKHQHHNDHFNKADFNDSITSDNIVLSCSVKCKENNQQSSEIVLDSESAFVREHIFSEDHEHLHPRSRPTSPLSSTGNLVTTNAAGKALLKRLSVDIVSPEGGCTTSTIGTTNDIDPDNDTGTELSGDVSRIDLSMEQDQEQQATYTNPIICQPTPYPIPLNFDASVQQQQWMIPSPQPDFLYEHDYSNMQYTVPMDNVAAQMGIENEITHPHPILMPQFYGQGIPMAPPMHFSNVYQPQLQSSYIAPMPVKYEQVAVGGCVFFNPVYDFYGEYGVNNSDVRSVGSTNNTLSSLNFSIKNKEGKSNDVEISKETNKAPHSNETHNNEKKKGKSKRFKKRYSPKKNTKGEEKGIK